MFSSFLNTEVKVTRVSNAVAAGTSAINCTHVDMTGFDAVAHICCMGTLTASQVTSLKAQQGNAANDSDMADIASAVTANAADAHSNRMLVLDLHKSQISKLYVRAVVNRATANAVIDSVIAIQYRARSLPQAPDATTLSASKNFA